MSKSIKFLMSIPFDQPRPRRWSWLNLIIPLLLLGVLSSSPATAAKPQPQVASASLPLADYLAPDGSLQLPTGISGSLDVTGYQMVSAPGEAPRFAPTMALGEWADNFGYHVIDGSINALAIDSGGNIYAGGGFFTAGGLSTANIAMWDGNIWSALGSGTDNEVESLAIDSNDNLYVGGLFTAAGGFPANYIAMWDGISWSALGSGVTGGAIPSVDSLAVDSSDNVYVGGKFNTAGGVSASNIAMWDGSSFSAVGAGLSNRVYALLFDSGGTLYAGGQFTGKAAMWNGSSWSVLGAGMTGGQVFALAFDASTNLIAGGSFLTAGGAAANKIAQWNGSAWSTLGSGLDGDVEALALDVSNNLIVGGNFNTAGGAAANKIAQWNGSAWSSLGLGMDAKVNAFVLDASNNLIAGGDFTTANGAGSPYIAQWDGVSLSSYPTDLGQGIAGPVYAMAVDSSGNLYVGGGFTSVGGILASRIAMWDGSSWFTLGTGSNNGSVFALAVDASDNLYAGGAFNSMDGTTVNRIAMWNGSSWSALGSGMNFGSFVWAIDIDTSGNVYAGGTFTSAGGTAANRIAMWNGSSWSALGSGMDNIVYGLASDNSGNLYAGGSFTTAGGTAASRIARWNGSSWSALGSGVNSNVLSLAVDTSGNLYAGGGFTTAGGTSANYIAMWNGSSWSALGSGMDNGVEELAFDSNGDLYVGGYFTMAGGISANRIAIWNGTDWSTLGSGTDANVRGLAININDDIFVGGEFSTAGSKPSVRIGQWTWVPFIVNDDNYNTLEDTPLTVPAITGVMSNDSGTTAVSIDLLPSQTVSFTLDNDGGFYYEPVAHFNGVDTFTYIATDGTITDTATVTVTVTTVNDVPMANDDWYTTTEDTPLAVAATGIISNDTDIELDVLSVVSYTQPSDSGLIMVWSDGAFTYTPTMDVNGWVTFTYQISDSMDVSNWATVYISVTAVNDAPVANNDWYMTMEDTPLVVASGVISNDVDVDMDTLWVVSHTLPSDGGSLMMWPDGTFTYTPTMDVNGWVTFTYQISDSMDVSNWATVYISVTFINDAPMGVNDMYTTTEDTSLVILTTPLGVLGNDTDSDGPSLTAVLVASPDNGFLAMNADGTFVYIPDLGFTGMDVFTYTVFDGEWGDTAVVTINVLSPGGGNFTLNSNITRQGWVTHTGTIITAGDGVATYTTTTDATGEYTLSLPIGTYTVTYMYTSYLSTWQTDVSSAGQPLTLPDKTLLGGDINDDGVINILDISFISGRFSLSCPFSGNDMLADLNQDCIVSIADVTIATGNYGQTTPY